MSFYDVLLMLHDHATLFVKIMAAQPGFFKAGVTWCQNEVTHQIFMWFLPPVVRCLAYKGGGGSRAPQDPPWLRPYRAGDYDALVFEDV